MSQDQAVEIMINGIVQALENVSSSLNEISSDNLKVEKERGAAFGGKVNQLSIDTRDALTFPLLVEISENMPKERRVLFVSHFSFRDHVKYLFLKMHQYGAENSIDICWISKNKHEVDMLVTAGYQAKHWDYSPRMADYVMKSAVVIKSTHMAILPRHCLLEACCAGAVKIQLWHGIPAKRIGYADFIDWGNIHDFAGWAHDCLTTEKILIESEHLKTVYRAGFPAGDIVALGSCRASSLLIQSDPEPGELLGADATAIEQLRERKRAGKKVILYAPTFREKRQSLENYEKSVAEFVSIISNNDEYALYIKPHLNFEIETKYDFQSIVSNSRNCYIIDPRSDIYLFLRYSDYLITDYSSVHYDYLVSQKPILFFRPDYAEYISTRKLQNYEIEAEFPAGPIIENATEIIEGIESSLSEPYVANRGRLLEYFHGDLDPASTLDRVSDFVIAEVNLRADSR